MSMLAFSREWNDIIRDVIFPDTELKTLMKLPAKTSIIKFIDEYFVQAGTDTTVLTDQAVRIVYGDVGSADVNHPYVTKNWMSFDIFVKNKDLHNVSNDRLEMRTHLIAHRLAHLLMHDERYVNHSGFRFWPKWDGVQKTTTAGYARYTLQLFYMKVY